MSKSEVGSRAFMNVSVELALNSRVSTGGWSSVKHYGSVSQEMISQEQLDYVSWCLGHVPHVGETPPHITCGEEVLDPRAGTLGGRWNAFEPTRYQRLHWDQDREQDSVDFSTQERNGYWLEQGMSQEMVHVAGAVAQIGVCMIGGVDVDLVPMTHYFSSERPAKYVDGNLPEPMRDGGASATQCIDGLSLAKVLEPRPLSKAQLGQLLWAGYGCTPHETFKYYRTGIRDLVGQGKTIPSAAATYTVSLYASDEGGPSRYINWDEAAGAATHSLQPLEEGSHAWDTLQQLLPDRMAGSTLILVTSAGRLSPFFAMMEAGYCVLHIALQCRSLGYGTGLLALSSDQIRRAQASLNISELPIALMSVGKAPDPATTQQQ
jgi:hypothetical protein